MQIIPSARCLAQATILRSVLDRTSSITRRREEKIRLLSRILDVPNDASQGPMSVSKDPSVLVQLTRTESIKLSLEISDQATLIRSINSTKEGLMDVLLNDIPILHLAESLQICRRAVEGLRAIKAQLFDSIGFYQSFLRILLSLQSSPMIGTDA